MVRKRPRAGAGNPRQKGSKMLAVIIYSPVAIALLIESIRYYWKLYNRA